MKLGAFGQARVRRGRYSFVACPSCGSEIRAADESGLVSVLQEHLYEEHALEMPRERVRENVTAQLKEFDGYNARPISGA